MPFGATGLWATTVAVGATHAREAVSRGILDATSIGALLESSLTVADRHTVFGRAEAGRMPAHHLHAHEYSLSLFPLGKVQMGYVRHLRVGRGLVPGIGLFLVERAVAGTGASRRGAAPSVAVFFSIRPARHAM